MLADANEQDARRPVTQVITEEITAWITSGKYKPGDHLPPEGELAKHFNVSKPSVRESLRQLVAFGAVEICHGKPPVVRAMGSEPLVNFFHLAVTPETGGLREAVELRRGLEVQAVLLAAQRATDDDIKELGRIIELLDKSKNDRNAWVPAHVQFHIALVKAAHNRFFTFLLEALKDTIERSNRMIIAAQPNRDPNLSFARHRAIFEAIKAHSTDLARLAIEDHFNAVEKVLDAKLDKAA